MGDLKIIRIGAMMGSFFKWPIVKQAFAEQVVNDVGVTRLRELTFWWVKRNYSLGSGEVLMNGKRKAII